MKFEDFISYGKKRNKKVIVQFLIIYRPFYNFGQLVQFVKSHTLLELEGGDFFSLLFISTLNTLFR